MYLTTVLDTVEPRAALSRAVPLENGKSNAVEVNGNGGRAFARTRWLLMVSCLWSAACGAKDIGVAFTQGRQLEADDAGLAIGECRGDEDCPFEDRCSPRACVDRRCVDLDAVNCDDGDPCTTDVCNPRDGECSSEPVTPDADGDGHRQPLPGFVPGSANACGDDCDDQAPSALPGGVESCDGVDNDCNGVTDDGYVFSRTGRPALVVAEGKKGAESSGLVHTGEQYVALVTVHDEHYQARLVGLGDLQTFSFTSDVVLGNNDTFGGGLTWSGQVLALAWEDRRDSDYEIYFNRFDDAGSKLDPDLRISDASGFSLDPTLLFTGTDYLVGWTDGRNGSDDFKVYGQRVTLLGRPLGSNVNLTPDFFNAKGAGLTPGITEIGITFLASSPYGEQVVFRAAPYDLSVLGPAVAVSEPNATGGGSVFVDGNYVVSWSEYTPGVGPGQSIWAAVVDRNGTILQPAQPLTNLGGFARSHSMLSLGDRLILAWANDRGQSYDVFYQTFSASLQPLSDVVQVTATALDEVAPRLRFGPEGELALLYTEHTIDHGPRVLMETLSCR